jgi:Uma2 family endonuclease
MSISRAISLSAEPSKRLWTYGELCREFEETNQPVELWEGELIMSPSPSPRHQLIVGRLFQLLGQYVVENKLGQIFFAPLDVVLSPHRVVQPDIFFISNERVSLVQDAIEGVPELIIEVISEGSWRRDRIEKKALYEQFGVVEYWIVDPEAETVEIFGLKSGAFQLVSKAGRGMKAESKLLGGFEADVDNLLAAPAAS